jgi:TolB-like protein
MGAASPASAAAEKKPKLVVLAIKPVDESTARIAASLTEAITTDLAKAGRFEVMGESELTAMLGFEKKKQLLGCSDGSCLAEIGGAIGCDYLLLGTMGKLGTRFRLDLKLADVRRSKIAARDGAEVDTPEVLTDLGRRMLQNVLLMLDGKPVPASPEPTSSVGTASKQTSSSSGPIPFVVMGIGGAALIAGGVTTGVTVAQKSDLKYQEADLRASAGIITAGVGLAALAAGVIWAAVAPSASSTTMVGIAPLNGGGAAVCAAGSF